MTNGTDPTKVNPQIVDAVKRSTQYAFGFEIMPDSGAAPISAGGAIAYEKVAQACALAIQDATDYERNIMSISTVAQGKALAMMFIDQANIEKYAIIFALAVVAPIAATVNAGLVGMEAAATLKNFPKS